MCKASDYSYIQSNMSQTDGEIFDQLFGSPAGNHNLKTVLPEEFLEEVNNANCLEDILESRYPPSEGKHPIREPLHIESIER